MAELSKLASVGARKTDQDRPRAAKRRVFNDEQNVVLVVEKIELIRNWSPATPIYFSTSRLHNFAGPLESRLFPFDR